MNTLNTDIEDSLKGAGQGGVLSALASFDDKLAQFLTGPGQQLRDVTKRLGPFAVAIAIAAIAAMGAVPGQAQAQSQQWENTLNDALQKQRQVDFANQASRVIAEQRGLSNKDQNLVGLASLFAGAATKGNNAPIASAVFGAGVAMLIPNNAQAQNNFSMGSNGGVQHQAINPQTQAMQQAYSSYVQYAEPQYQIALRANMEGNMQVRRDAVMAFGNAWNAASQVGVPLHTVAEQVAKFQQLQRMDSQALQYGLSGGRPQPTVQYQPGMLQ